MLTLLISAVIFAIIPGIVIKEGLDNIEVQNAYGRALITFKELIIGVAVIVLVVGPVVTIVGWNIAKGNALSYNEYWNGFETKANFYTQQCSRDSGCSFDYNCDPYIVMVPVTTTDTKGNSHTTYVEETHYHSCPYTTEEWDFTVDTTLGNYHIAHTIPTNPIEYRAGNGFPNVTRGIPPFWQDVKNRLDAGKPGPVTKRMSYDNYLLASDSSILKTYSDKIATFLKAGLLPQLYNKLHDFYYADKAYFVGFTPSNASEWVEDVSYLNAAFGNELQGDLHLVIANNPEIANDKDGYLTALKAYWSDPNVFGDDALSKNTVIVLIVTDGTTITGVRSITGMPLGNELLLTQTQNLVGKPLSASQIIGRVNGTVYVNDAGKTKVRTDLGAAGLLPRLLWGLDNPATKFVRVSMTANSGAGAGFGYLSDQIEPNDTTKFLLTLLVFIIATGVWGTLAYIGDENNERRHFYY